MKIVVLDGHTLNPGDLDWRELSHLGELTVHDRTVEHLIVERSQSAEILFTNKTPLNTTILNALPNLKYIGVLATGYDVVDIEAARKKDIIVTNIPNYGADSVAQMVFAHILQITNQVATHARDVREGGWSKKDDFCYWLTPQIELKDKVLGIIGYGEIGKATARIAGAFKMKVLITSGRHIDNLPDNTRYVSLDTLLSSSDIISLHCPLTAATRKFINEEKIERIKDGAILINCSRGPLIEEKALAAALQSGKIAAAGLDVLASEPAKADNPLLSARNCYITPHIAWATRESRQRLLTIAIENLKSYLSGSTENRIV